MRQEDLRQQITETRGLDRPSPILRLGSEKPAASFRPVSAVRTSPIKVNLTRQQWQHAFGSWGGGKKKKSQSVEPVDNAEEKGCGGLALRLFGCFRCS